MEKLAQDIGRMDRISWLPSYKEFWQPLGFEDTGRLTDMEEFRMMLLLSAAIIETWKPLFLSFVPYQEKIMS